MPKKEKLPPIYLLCFCLLGRADFAGDFISIVGLLLLLGCFIVHSVVELLLLLLPLGLFAAGAAAPQPAHLPLEHLAAAALVRPGI